MYTNMIRPIMLYAHWNYVSFESIPIQIKQCGVLRASALTMSLISTTVEQTIEDVKVCCAACVCGQCNAELKCHSWYLHHKHVHTLQGSRTISCGWSRQVCSNIMTNRVCWQCTCWGFASSGSHSSTGFKMQLAWAFTIWASLQSLQNMIQKFTSTQQPCLVCGASVKTVMLLTHRIL